LELAYNVNKASRAIDSYAAMRLRRWLRIKSEQADKDPNKDPVSLTMLNGDNLQPKT
jgi:hypothetical protein